MFLRDIAGLFDKATELSVSNGKPIDPETLNGYVVRGDSAG